MKSAVIVVVTSMFGETVDNSHHGGKQHAYGLEKKEEANALFKHIMS